MRKRERRESTDVWAQALAAWSRVVGNDNVSTDESALSVAETATFLTSQVIGAIIRPANRAEVQECVRVANKFKIPLYPLSCGRNWGFGSGVPVQDGCAILHLERLNRIVDFDEQLAYVTVEPGVTQRQLFEYLGKRGSKLWMDASGSTMDASLIGNIAERGVGFTPYADHFAHVSGFEVVLPDGACLHTGFGRFEGSKATKTCRWGVGPYLDGLFTQSGFGIITQMTIWLMSAPAHFQACYFNVEQDFQLEQVIEILRPLRLNGTIRGAIRIFNDYSVLSSLRQYPWAETNGTTPLDADVLLRLKGPWDMGAWHGSMGLYGTRSFVAESRRQIKRAMKSKVRRLQFLDDSRVRIAPWLQKPYRWLTGLDLSRILQATLPGYGLLKGIPTEHAIAATYWRKKHLPPLNMNPDRDRCGLIWCCPAAPFKGNDARAIVEIATGTLSAHQFEPMVGFTLITERCLYAMIAISYDRDVRGEDARALRCHDELLRELARAGYYPYRLGTQSMDSLPQPEATYSRFVRMLKAAVDPNNILAPGRYESLSE